MMKSILGAVLKANKLIRQKVCVPLYHRISFSNALQSHFDKVLENKTIVRNLEEDEYESTVLKSLVTANPFELNSNGEEIPVSSREGSVQGITLNFGSVNVFRSTLYIRDFYPRLFDLLLKEKHSVLIGNPGISKSWFQWYVMYRLVNENMVSGDKVPPLVIVRQLGEQRMTFYFPKSLCAYVTSFLEGMKLLLQLKPSVSLYLFEPGNSLIEPVMCGVQTILTFSSNQTRYHKLSRDSGIKYYMPCWTLPELQLVAAHVAQKDSTLDVEMTPDAVSKRFNRFGGIFRYVIPTSMQYSKMIEAEQDTSLSMTKQVNVFSPQVYIETCDDFKENVTRFALQYDVQYGGKLKGKRTEFGHFQMKVASDYVRNQKRFDLLPFKDLFQACRRLLLMFEGVKTYDSDLFEIVVASSIFREAFYWEVYEKERRMWINHTWELDEYVVVANEDVKVSKMKPGVLYRPYDKHFPVVEFLFVSEDKEVFGIKVTTAYHHSNEIKTYDILYKLLGIPNTQKVHIYTIPCPEHANVYPKHKHCNFFDLVANDDDTDLPNVHFSTLKTLQGFQL